MKKSGLAVLAVFSAVLVLFVALPALGGTRLGDLMALVQRLNGAPSGGAQSISVSTTSATQSTTYTGGETILIANDDSSGADQIYCNGVVGSASTVTTSTGVPIPHGEKFYLTLTRKQTHVACITASAASTAKLYVME